MQKHPIIEQLIDAQLDFLDQEFNQSETVQTEFVQFYQWFRKQTLQDLWTSEAIHQLIQQQILNTPASSFLVEQIAEHIRFALVHPVNDSSKIADVIPVLTIDKIAQYVASKSGHRQRLIKTVVNNPAFAAMITQLIQHSIQDYMDNSVIAKSVPGVSRFMKMGKSVLESVTDTNLDQTIQLYLQKNVQKLTQTSESVLNQHFDEEKLYHFQANLWHKVKDLPLSVLKNYIEVQDLSQTVNLGHEIWDHLRQSDYLKQQVHDGVYAWYVRNQARPFDLLLHDLNIDEALVQQQLQQLLNPVIQKMIAEGYLKQRARHYLEKFYYSEKTQQILNLQTNE
ncbi:hypothetical protein [Acinetobacter towneri]|uniref:DUF2336 domain-containing protein n=1 Tax=Acinetobacter towneri TaxID=202956 RepID=A0AB35LZW9_9GAMM|nr:hypothetical protein [Acinetobacter towneri]MDM1718445.1 hypothetical protein [Acinetobacter towneri]MDM1730471.1 hypothetical protein [Acinetobacter towneri]MDM1732959.1 hypothetical protein [Acinetobacter towneri]MDM1735358.1 hypothetical protein [Acinetobacter towneri]MDM1738602.1 hypothetical protein [Acinetobacter towneri]